MNDPCMPRPSTVAQGPSGMGLSGSLAPTRDMATPEGRTAQVERAREMIRGGRCSLGTVATVTMLSTETIVELIKEVSAEDHPQEKP
jgi:hypothetical protein